MAVGNFELPKLSPIAGVQLGTAKAKIKKWDRADLTLFKICEGASVAAVFTKNRFSAEPVKICKQHLASAKPKYLLINAGNANACTGEPGYKAAIETCEALAQIGMCNSDQVLPFSTGVIGEVLPANKIIDALPSLMDDLSEDNWHNAAKAIMTTDTRPKAFTATADIAGTKVTINGIAKGAGMINPNMGTMLGYIATDAAVTQDVLQSLTQAAADKSFNRITIDGDTSTNDSMVVVASAQSKAPLISDIESKEYEALFAAVSELCQRLAIEMVRDAEGATKCVKVNVRQGKNAQECLDVAYAICHSPLVKTALFASDPNWGRIVAAIGYAGIEDLDPNSVNVFLDEVQIVANGGRAPSYSEALGQGIFSKSEFDIHVELGRGTASESLWTSDLSHEYVRINAEYRS